MAYRYLNPEAMRNLIQGDVKIRGLLEGLQSCTSSGTGLEFLKTRVDKQGWQGSITKTGPNSSAQSAFIPNTQLLFRCIDSTTVGGDF